MASSEGIDPVEVYTAASDTYQKEIKDQGCCWYLFCDIAVFDRTDHVEMPPSPPASDPEPSPSPDKENQKKASLRIPCLLVGSMNWATAVERKRVRHTKSFLVPESCFIQGVANIATIGMIIVWVKTLLMCFRAFILRAWRLVWRNCLRPGGTSKSFACR